MKIGYAAPLALVVLGAAPQPQDAAGGICSVRYSRILLGSYEQSTAKRTLPGIMIEGSAAPQQAAFNFFDDDGFLTLATLLAAWQADGHTAANRTADVAIDKRDAALLGHAARVGTGYFGAILDYAAALPSPTPEQALEIEQARGHLALWELIEGQAATSIVTAKDGMTTLPKGFIARVGGHLESLRPTAQQPVNSRYNDMVTNSFSRLCDPAAASTLLGRMLCDRDLGTGAARATPYCRSSAGITSPARALTCEVRPVDGKPVLANCTDGPGGASVPAPALGG